jgi:hypothetical protein
MVSDSNTSSFDPSYLLVHFRPGEDQDPGHPKGLGRHILVFDATLESERRSSIDSLYESGKIWYQPGPAQKAVRNGCDLFQCENYKIGWRIGLQAIKEAGGKVVNINKSSTAIEGCDIAIELRHASGDAQLVRILVADKR